MMDEPQRTVEHLKLVQGVVTRIAGNSAQMKTWAVSLVTATFIFSGLSDDPHWLIAAGGCVPVIAFWIMDARYLRLERCYIKLYNAVATDASDKHFDLDYRPYASTVGSFWNVARSWSVCGFYGALLIVMIMLVLFLVVMGS